MKRFIPFICLILTVVLLFSGCDLLSFNAAENLIRPPKLSGSNGELQSAFEKAVGEKGEYILRYPSYGKYRSAYVRYDCDNDGTEEAFVFYSLKSEEMSVYMYMLNYSDGEWRALGEIQGDGSDIYSIEFCDLNNDGVSEILVGWNPIDTKNNKKLSVYYSYKNSQNLNYRALAIESYTAMYTEDLDGDGETEIFLALINSTSDTYMTEAKLLKMTNENGSDAQISAVGQLNLYSEITGVVSVNSGMSGGKKYIYLDESADNTYLTELICWDDEKKAMVAPIAVDVLSITSCPTGRAFSMSCTDIDGDGELEIPVTSLLPDSSIIRKSKENSDNPLLLTENIYITKWCKYDDGNFLPVKEYIRNDDDAFDFKYDSDDMSGKSVTFYPDEHMTQFFAVKKSSDPEKPDESVLLFTITAVGVDETVSIGAYLASGSEYKYIIEISDNGVEEGITKQYILDNFEVI